MGERKRTELAPERLQRQFGEAVLDVRHERQLRAAAIQVGHGGFVPCRQYCHLRAPIQQAWRHSLTHAQQNARRQISHVPSSLQALRDQNGITENARKRGRILSSVEKTNFLTASETAPPNDQTPDLIADVTEEDQRSQTYAFWEETLDEIFNDSEVADG